MLDFIQKNVVFPTGSESFYDVAVERVVFLQVFEGEVFEVDGNDALYGDARGGQVVFI